MEGAWWDSTGKKGCSQKWTLSNGLENESAGRGLQGTASARRLREEEQQDQWQEWNMYVAVLPSGCQLTWEGLIREEADQITGRQQAMGQTLEGSTLLRGVEGSLQRQRGSLINWLFHHYTWVHAGMLVCFPVFAGICFLVERQKLMSTNNPLPCLEEAIWSSLLLHKPLVLPMAGEHCAL